THTHTHTHTHTQHVVKELYEEVGMYMYSVLSIYNIILVFSQKLYIFPFLHQQVYQPRFPKEGLRIRIERVSTYTANTHHYRTQATCQDNLESKPEPIVVQLWILQRQLRKRPILEQEDGEGQVEAKPDHRCEKYSE